MDVHRCDDEKSDNIGHPEEVTDDDLHKSDAGKNEKGAQKCKVEDTDSVVEISNDEEQQPKKVWNFYLTYYQP